MYKVLLLNIFLLLSLAVLSQPDIKGYKAGSKFPNFTKVQVVGCHYIMSPTYIDQESNIVGLRGMAIYLKPNGDYGYKSTTSPVRAEETELKNLISAFESKFQISMFYQKKDYQTSPEGVYSAIKDGYRYEIEFSNYGIEFRITSLGLENKYRMIKDVVNSQKQNDI